QFYLHSFLDCQLSLPPAEVTVRRRSKSESVARTLQHGISLLKKRRRKASISKLFHSTITCSRIQHSLTESSISTLSRPSPTSMNSSKSVIWISHRLLLHTSHRWASTRIRLQILKKFLTVERLHCRMMCPTRDAP